MPSLWFSGEVIARRVLLADSLRSRLRGLVMRSGMAADEALLLEPARQIHTLGMRFEIDVVFCDENWTVVHIVRRLRPFRITRWVPRARRVVELAAGSLPQQVEVGTRLELR